MVSLLSIGMVQGILGAGGGLLMVPLFSLLLDYTFSESVNVSLMVTAIIMFVASVINFRAINYKTALTYFALAFFGALLGSQAAQVLPESIKQMAFVFTVSAILLTTLLKKQVDNTDKKNLADDDKYVFYAASFFTGTLTPILGIGGGFIVIPALMAFRFMTIREAINTSYLAIFLTATTSLISKYLLDNEVQHIMPTGFFEVLGYIFCGFVAGQLIKTKMSDQQLKLFYQVFLFAVLIIATASALK